MNKLQANSENFMARSASFSTHGSRTGKNLLGWGEREELTPVQQRDVLIARLNGLERELKENKAKLDTKLPKPVFLSACLKRNEIVAQMDEVRNGLRELRGHSKCTGVDIGECIIKIVQERMTKPQYEQLIREALIRFEKANGSKYAGSEHGIETEAGGTSGKQEG